VALSIGIIAVGFYILGCWVLDKLHIDDVVESAPIHLFGGIWGTLATGIFSNKRGLAYGYADSGSFFGYQVVGLLAMMAWSSVFAISFFLLMKKLDLLRIKKEIEIVGLDIAELGGLTEEVYQKVKIDYGRNMAASMSPEGERKQLELGLDEENHESLVRGT
jgi:ammonium transporter, Amt family